MAITKDDVAKALNNLNLPEGGSVVKGDGDKDDLGDANGGSGELKPPGDDMNDKAGNKKGKGDKADKAEKSMPATFEEGLPTEVETKVEVSTFLKSLVDHTAAQVNGLRDFVVKSDAAQDARFEEIMESTEDLAKSLGNIGIVLKAICERIGVLENQPTVAKSQTAAQAVVKSQGVERRFENPVETGTEGTKDSGANGLYKSLVGKHPMEIKKSITEAMCDLVRKGELADTDLINFESFGYVTPEADIKLRSLLS